MAFHHTTRQLFTHTEQILRRSRVLETRDRRLRCQPLALNRIPIQQHLVNRILGQSIRVVAVRIPAGNPKHALLEKLSQLVGDPIRIPHVTQAVDQSPCQPQPLVRSLQQDRPAIRTASLLVERRDYLARKQLRKQPTLCAIVGHLEAPWFVGFGLYPKPFSTQGLSFWFLPTNYPG